jgi:hypothetical protein
MTNVSDDVRFEGDATDDRGLQDVWRVSCAVCDTLTINEYSNTRRV